MQFQFLKTVVLLAFLLVALLFYPLHAWSSPEVISAVVAAGIITFANVVIGYLTLEFGINRPTKQFMIAVFGGMGVRMALILVAYALLLVNGFNPTALTFSLMGFYIVFMVAEILYVTRAMNGRKVRLEQQQTKTIDSTLSYVVEHTLS